MSASPLYKDFINSIAPFLAEEEFSRKGETFYYKKGENWGLLDFQKSRKSTRSEVIFTINLGICSASLLKFFYPDRMQTSPALDDCQWSERIGFLLPQKQDVWWTMTDQNILMRVDQLKSDLIDFAIPVIHQHIEDRQLCQEWLSKKSPGLTNIQRLMNLSVLLKIENMKDALNQTLMELKENSLGKPSDFTVKQHIQKLTNE